MGLRATIQAATATAFAAVGDLPQDIIIRRPGTLTYDPDTGMNTPGTPTDYPVQAIVSKYRQHEIDGTLVLSTDRKAMIRQAALSITPMTTDKAVIGGIEHTIVDKSQDAAGATWTLQVRA